MLALLHSALELRLDLVSPASKTSLLNMANRVSLIITMTSDYDTHAIRVMPSGSVQGALHQTQRDKCLPHYSILLVAFGGDRLVDLP
jgi:hypothetical protein